MNERIKELAEQAEMAANKGDHVDVKIMMEKFAELIVRECMNIAYEYDAPKMSGPGMIIAGQIQDHFGLDE